MPFTHTVASQISAGGTTTTSTNAITAGAEMNLSETITASTTDVAVSMSLDVSQAKSVYIVADQNLTLETNNATSPADTLSLVAGVPYAWQDGYGTLAFGTDIVGLFVTNGTGTDATLQAFILFDPTV